ncbi:FAD-dependent oxidoreductase [Rapidithrix thailandica]|uniref:FAD-dependent oxidoreductase n=1 Tax=Rapidithrix thailandica TaxID=413964 RepID=A0AAW9RYU2_9BACT
MTPKRIIIVGGLSAGPSAAAKARRTDEHCEIILFEKTANISYATCGIPYALSGKISHRDQLMVVKPDLLRQRFNIDVRLNEPVVEIDPIRHKVYTTEGEYNYDKLIYAAGGNAVIPPIGKLELFEAWSPCKTLEHFDKIVREGVLANAKHITIAGAGLIGVEVAENLFKAGKEVSLVEMAPTILPAFETKFSLMAKHLLAEKCITLYTGKKINYIDPQTSILYLDDDKSIETDYLLIGTGVRPNTELLTSKGAVALKNGALLVNEKMETNLPDIYAAGDCASLKNLVTGEHSFFPMGTHSNKGGRTAGANAAGGKEQFKGANSTAILKIFEYTLGKTGCTPRELESKGIPFQSTFFITQATPGFYPDSSDIFVEIYHHTETHQLLGAQVFGKRGVDKRVDVFSTCIYAKLTIDELPQLDLAYAPPFSPAKDPVIVAGYIASNLQRKQFNLIDSIQLQRILSSHPSSAFTLLDVRNPEELLRHGQILTAHNIPLDTLREHIQTLDSTQPIIVYCQKGLRGYLACLILQHYGFEDVRNLAGGYTAWQQITNPLEEKKPNNPSPKPKVAKQLP